MTHPFSTIKNSTGKHKDWYNEEFVKIFCKLISKDEKKFNSKSFIDEFKKNYKSLELSDRLTLIANLFDKYIHTDYKSKLKVLACLFGEPLKEEEGMFNYGFYLFPVSKFVEINASNDIDASLEFIEELTKRFTGEYAIRTVANIDEKKTLRQIKKWSKDKNVHVRRLASEGVRPQLPWGKKIEWVSENPEKIIPIYEILRNDESSYVRKSVANSMGDIIKINPKLAIKTFNAWLEKPLTKENVWVIQHAIRKPVKDKNKLFVELNKKINSLSY